MVGETVGKYRIFDQVGRGAMGTVYRAKDETLDRDVAIKLLNPELNDPEVARRFRVEAITVARLNHPGIATVHDLFQRDDRWLMVMEFVRGETLEQLLTKRGSLPLERAAELVSQALVALSHAHAMGVVHRDLKPANLMVTESGRIKIMDFGLARVVGSKHMTSAGLMVGTPAYMAPEQVLGLEVDARADLYAIGIVFYQLLTGKLPFKGDTPFAMAQAQVNDPPTPVQANRSGLPPWVGQVLGRALMKGLDRRFQSAGDFREAIHRGRTGLPLMLDEGGTSRTPPELQVTRAFPPPGSAAPAKSGAGALTPQAAAARSRAAVPQARPAASTPHATRGVLAAAAIVALLGSILAFVWWQGRSAVPESVPAATSAAIAQPAPAAPTPVKATPPQAPAPRPATPAAPPSNSSSSTAISQGPASPQSPVSETAAKTGLSGRRGPEAPPADPLVTFDNVRLLAVEGRKGKEQDVLLNFANGQVVVAAKKGGSPITSMTYKRIGAATYVHAKEPRWAGGASAAPPTDLDLPGGLFSGSRHWLVLQSTTGYIILRLEDENWRPVLATLESRTGVPTIRPALGK